MVTNGLMTLDPDPTGLRPDWPASKASQRAEPATRGAAKQLHPTADFAKTTILVPVRIHLCTAAWCRRVVF